MPTRSRLRTRRSVDVDTAYWALIEAVTVCEVPHQRMLEVAGPEAVAFVQHLVTRDLSAHEVGQCKYAFMVDRSGAVVGDPVIVRLADDRYWLATPTARLASWSEHVAVAAGFRVDLSVPDVVPVQIQGPRATSVMEDLFGDELVDLGYHRSTRRTHDGIELVITRTGWGGTDGFEVYVTGAARGAPTRFQHWWETVIRAGERHGIVAAGPDEIHRIESGMVSLDRDIGAGTNPFEIGEGYEWMVDLDQPDDFVGKDALRHIRRIGPGRRLVGVDFDGSGFPSGGRSRRRLLSCDGVEVGEVTSAVHSPRLRRDIGFAMVAIEHAAPGTRLWVNDVEHESNGVTIVGKVRVP